MFTKKRVFIGVLVFFTLLVVVVGISLIPRKVFKINSDDVSKIAIIKGDNGAKIEVTDHEQIERIVNELNDITYQKNGFRSIKGFSYTLKLYNKNGKEIHEITLRGDKSITYKGFHYKSKKGKFDLEYLHQLFED